MNKPCFITLRMKGTRPNTCASWHTDYYVGLLVPAIVNFCKIINDLIKTYSNKVCKLHLHHALIPLQTESKGCSYNRTFAKWCIANPFFPKFFYKPLRNL